MSTVYALILISIATGIISITIAKTKIFKSIRDSIQVIDTFFYDLIKCSFCLNFWVGAFLFSIYAWFSAPSNLLFILGITQTPLAVIWLGILVWLSIVFFSTLVSAITYKCIKSLEI